MSKYYLFGENIGYSLSPEIYREYGLDYSIKDLSEKEFIKEITEKNFDGINITKPYKELALKYIDEISPQAKKIGAVNTVINKGGVLYGYNTDGYGFQKTAQRFGIDIKNKTVLILGSGGAGKAVRCAVEESGGTPVMISRGEDYTYDNAVKPFASAEILVNASRFGTRENSDSPIGIYALSRLKWVIDLNYSPFYSELVRTARRINIPAVNGLYMLTAQAQKSYELFTGKTGKDIYKKLFEKVHNIILTGLPASGKSTVGEVLAKLTGKEFIDTDSLIESKYGKIKDIISRSGEEDFRKKETEIIKELTEKVNAVISTGGGAVISKENRKILSSLGTVVYLKRDCADITPDGNRPLLKDKTLQELYNERKEFYSNVQDFSVDNDESPMITANKIKEIIDESIVY